MSRKKWAYLLGNLGKSSSSSSFDLVKKNHYFPRRLISSIDFPYFAACFSVSVEKSVLGFSLSLSYFSFDPITRRAEKYIRSIRAKLFFSHAFLWLRHSVLRMGDYANEKA